MMECRRLKNAEELAAAGLWQVYTEAFPREERRSWEQHCLAMDREECFCCLEMRDKGETVGLVFCWEMEQGVFVEHLAVCAERRGQGLGHLMLECLQKWGKPLVLEAELPATETARRRLRFYRSAGFVILPDAHVQLPFHRDTPEVPMHLLSWPCAFTREAVKALEQFLRERVMIFAG
ncbi:MAG: GNAT family N-acetyltransferase [Akkermansia sp.]|nr:GNAT family N-acetyltransferase [Akkermansia sp.]